MDLRSVLLEIHAAFEAAGVEHALIGGLALAAHGAARATADLDLLVPGTAADRIEDMLLERGYARLHRSEFAANYAGSSPARGRIDLLFARRERGLGILRRATGHDVAGRRVRVVDASDLVGLKVQAYANDPRRRHADLADIERLIRTGNVDLARAREYFQLFDREKDLDDLLAEGNP